MLIFVLEVLSGGVPAHEDGEKGDAGGDDPGHADHHHGPLHCDGHVVLERLGYCIIP